MTDPKSEMSSEVQALRVELKVLRIELAAMTKHRDKLQGILRYATDRMLRIAKRLNPTEEIPCQGPAQPDPEPPTPEAPSDS